jgi:hypothetical protein
VVIFANGATHHNRVGACISVILNHPLRVLDTADSTYTTAADQFPFQLQQLLTGDHDEGLRNRSCRERQQLPFLHMVLELIT